MDTNIITLRVEKDYAEKLYEFQQLLDQVDLKLAQKNSLPTYALALAGLLEGLHLKEALEKIHG